MEQTQLTRIFYREFQLHCEVYSKSLDACTGELMDHLYVAISSRLTQVIESTS